MELESNASPDATDAAMPDQGDTEPIAMEDSSEFLHAHLPDRMMGLDIVEDSSPEQIEMRSGTAPLSQSEAAQEEPVAEGIDQAAAAPDPELPEEHGADGEDENGPRVSVAAEELKARLERIAIGGEGEPAISGDKVDGLVAPTPRSSNRLSTSCTTSSTIATPRSGG